MGELVTVLNAAGGAFVAFAAHMLVQSSALIILLAALDLVLRRRVKAVVRYWIWLLVLAKLLLPPSLSAPTGVAYWVGGKLPTLSGPIEPLVEESSTPSLPANGTTVPSEPRGPDPRPSVQYTPEEPPVAHPDNTLLYVTSHAPLVTWQALVLLGWAVVVIVMAVLLAQRALFVRRLVAQSRAPGPEIVELLGLCARRMRVRTDLAVKLSPLSASPSVCGLRRPVILIPEEMLARLSVTELRAVLLHELAHIKRGDLWLNLLQAVLQVVYFFHPLLWLANVRIRRVREQAVDETVLAAMGEEAEDYPRTLLSVSRAAFGQPTLSLRLLGVVESEKALMDRIRHMVSRPFPKSTKLGFASLVLILGVGAALLPMARARNAASAAGGPEASAADRAVAGSSGNYVGDFVLDREIPLNLVAGTMEHPRLVTIEWIRIEATYGNGWCATARVGWSLTADSTWRIRLELLDSRGRLLRHARDRSTVFTGKAVPGGRGMRYAELELAPLCWDSAGRRQAAKIRLSLEPAQEPAPDRGVNHVLVLAAVNGKGQKPISGATVITTARYQDSRISLSSTDARGEYRIALPKAGLGYVRVAVQKEGYATMSTGWSNPSPSPVADVSLLELPERHVVEMVPAQTIGGVVRDEQGRPIAGVQVMCETHLQEVGGTTGLRRNVLTDGQGQWRIEGIAAGTDRLQLGFRHPEYAGDYFASRQLTPEQLDAARASEYAAVLHPGLAVGGVVLNEQGRPVPNAVVILAPRRNGRFHDEYTYTRTEAAGRFRFDCALDDRKDTMDDGGATGIFVDAPGYVPMLQRVVVEPNLAPLELRLQAGRTLTVRVVGPDGRPLAGAWTAVDPFAENREYGLWQDDTDEQGRVQIGSVGENGVRLTVGKSGYVTLRNHVLHASDHDQVVDLKPAPHVQGTVVDAETGQSIPNFDVAPVRDGRSYSYSASHFKDGRFELSFNEAEPKALQLKISALGYTPATSEPLSLEGAGTLAFKLAKDPSFRGDPAQRGRVSPPSDEPSAIKGIVQDPNGRPVADAVVETCPWVCPPTVTDAQGKFKLRLEAGLMRSGDRETPYLVARDRKQNLAAMIEFDRTAAQDLVVKLAPALTLSGRVTDAQGQGMPKARLVLYLWLGNGGYPLSEDAKPDSDGSYEIRAVPPEQRCSVDVSAEGYGRNSLEVPSAAAVNNHVKLEPTALQLANLEVRGVVVDAEDGPVAGAGVSAYGQGQPFQRTETDAQGRFTIRGVCAGAVEMQANVRGEMTLHGRARVQGGAKDVKIVVSPIRFAGQPVPAQSASLVGKPLPSLADLGIDLPTDQYKDKRVLLCFFDMGQRPSRYCVTALAKQADALRTKDVTVVMVQAAPAEQDALTPWAKEQSLPWRVYMIKGDAKKLRSLWGVQSLPRLILTNKDHVVRAEGLGLDDLQKRIEAVPLPTARGTQTRPSATSQSRDRLQKQGDPELAELIRTPIAVQAGSSGTSSPAEGAEGVGVNGLELTWRARDKAKAHNVYLGLGPESLKLLGKVEQARVPVPHLQCDTKYYWRVDEVQADGSTVSGPVRTFTTGGLAAWWKLDEESGDLARDSSGRGHRGTLHGDPQRVKDPSGGVLLFDGVDDYVDCGSSPSLMQVGSVSVAAWINVGAAGRDAKIVSNQETGSGYKLGVYGDKVEFEIRVRPDVIATTNRSAPGGTELQQDTWYHVVGVYEKGRYIRTYVNGRPDRDLKTAEIAAISKGPLVIGRESFAPTSSKTYWWLGALRDVCVFTYALNADEVKALYSGATPTALAAAPISSAPTDAKITLAPLKTRALLRATDRAKSPFSEQVTGNLSAWVKLEVLEQQVLALETLKPFSDNWAFARHQVVGLWSQKQMLDYLQGRLKDDKSVPIRLHIFFLPELKDRAEDLRQKICTLAREAKVDTETEVRMEQSVWMGSGESPFYLREGKIRTYYPGSMPRPDGGSPWLHNGLVDPNDLEQHILWRLTMPKNVPLKFRIEYDEASYPLAKQVVETARAVTKRVGLTELVGVTGALVDAVPESTFLGKWQALGDGVIQSVDIQPAGVCQVLVGEGSSVLQAGTSVTGTWSWTVKEILLDIKDPVMGRKGYPPYIYRASINEEGNLIIQKGEVWPQGSFMYTRPPQTTYKRMP